MKMRYSTRSTIVTVVEESKLKEVIDIIKESGSKSTSSGVIIVSPVDAISVL
jgi:nitrogen regulatory protein PII